MTSSSVTTPFGIYLHVPFCRVRCGYCDFNTYAAHEDGAGSQSSFVAAAAAEITRARTELAAIGFTGPVDTVFFGGGTPTLLSSSDLVSLLAQIRDTWGLAPHAEVTTEANPDSITAAYAQDLAQAGFTRVSIGMQSAVPSVLQALERTHNPENVAIAVAAVKSAGMQVSLDLIYGTPGETLGMWETSLRTAVALQPDHVSAYSLVIEPGTKMGSELRRGLIQAVDLDVQAQMYEVADDLLEAAGYHWYEISNWARSPENYCHHNLGYWQGGSWWGIGPGAHSFLGAHGGRDFEYILPVLGLAAEVTPAIDPESVRGVRWWNEKRPITYAQQLSQQQLPVAGAEIISPEIAQLEKIMLQIRLASGLAISAVAPERAFLLEDLAARNLIELDVAAQRIRLTRSGRLLADALVRDLT